jgi:hypothetical protein
LHAQEQEERQELDSAEFISMARRLCDMVAGAAVISSPMMSKIFANACAELERRRPQPRHRRKDVAARLLGGSRGALARDPEHLHLHVTRTRLSKGVVVFRLVQTSRD